MNADTNMARTPLYDLHQELGGKMVPFAGYEMPVQYKGWGIIKEHLHTRAQAGLFDVSHMGQLIVEGAGVTRALEKLVPVELEALAVNKQSYGLLTNDSGGILDDLIITRWADERFFIVVNAACKAQDIAHLAAHLGPDIQLRHLTEQALLALQGPAAKEIMAVLAPPATELHFMSGAAVTLDGVDAFVTRSGYTGEDGFEISLAAEHADKIARRILAFAQAEAIGLGARDSLRLEAGLCLYGHDMDADTSPVEAALSWSISKSRRSGGSKQGGFPGADTILAQLGDGVSRRRVGLRVEGRMPVREGAALVDASGKTVGRVTSGGFAPTLSAPIAMGYVDTELAEPGTGIQALVRDKQIPVQVAKLPFVPQRYYRG